MKKMYSLSVRLDLSDDRQARISKHLQSLHENTCQSINGFVIDAIANYIDYQSYTREQHIDDMRKAMREEMQRMFISSMPHQAPVIVPLSQPQTKSDEELDHELSAELEMFE